MQLRFIDQKLNQYGCDEFVHCSDLCTIIARVHNAEDQERNEDGHTCYVRIPGSNLCQAGVIEVFEHG